MPVFESCRKVRVTPVKLQFDPTLRCSVPYYTLFLSSVGKNLSVWSLDGSNLKHANKTVKLPFLSLVFTRSLGIR